ncbi:MAG: helix-turn-helix domain-containing protein [Campylobacteraceae bacterium]|jgi:phage repressor protein C with HTH and peptisase S24 domain|nr:helix-turn-helix domain-containing protein [Campylobacteraceae bacterium]
MTLGQKIKLHRQKFGWNQEELAKKSGVSLNSVKSYEIDKAKITLSILGKLAKALEKDISYFLEKENESLSQENVSPSPIKKISETFNQSADPSSKTEETVRINILSQRASAGTLSSIEDTEVFDTHETFVISQIAFKTPANAANLRTTQVDGYSMLPILLPDNWVIFDITKNTYSGDGLYVLNWRNVLMVKILQLSNKGTLEIISRNADYKSWEVDPDDQSVFQIIGKVIKVIF